MAKNNLKARITVDTSDYKKGMKAAKDALNSFGKDANDVLGNLTTLFGGSTDALKELEKNIKKSHDLFSELFRDASGGMSNLKKAIAGVGSIAVGLGLTAAIEGWKKLNAEADKFCETISGQQLKAGAKALRDTYKDILSEGAASTGSGIGEWWARTREQAMTNASIKWTNWMTGASDEEQRQAIETAGEIAQLAGKRAGIEKELAQTLAGQALMQGRINELNREANDSSKTKAERADAKAQSVNLTNIYYDKQIGLQRQIYDSLVEQNKLRPTQESLAAQYEAGEKLASLEEKKSAALSESKKSSSSIASSAKETQEAVELTLEAAKKLVLIQREQDKLETHRARLMKQAGMELDATNLSVSSSISMPSLVTDDRKGEGITVPIKPVVDTEAAQKAIIELSGIVESGVVGMSEAIGELVGNLINGEDAWGSFAQAGISVIADMLSTVGKAFVATGTGVIAAQLALKSGNGYAAITAGAAMVALAATMKTVMSNAAANWGGGYSAPVASSAYTPGTSLGSYGREMEIKVTGTLTAEGSKLKAVLNNEDYRTSITT